MRYSNTMYAVIDVVVKNGQKRGMSPEAQRVIRSFGTLNRSIEMWLVANQLSRAPRVDALWPANATLAKSQLQREPGR